MKPDAVCVEAGDEDDFEPTEEELMARWAAEERRRRKDDRCNSAAFRLWAEMEDLVHSYD